MDTDTDSHTMRFNSSNAELPVVEHFINDYLVLYNAETGEYYSSMYLPAEYLH